ncbi:MAG: HEAT repeat domain-containing protein [Nostoc sp.]
MITIPRHTSKPLFFLFCFTLLLTFLLCLPWVNAKETPKPKPQPWQIEGIIAALDDSYPKVKGYSFDKLATYEGQDLKIVLKKPEEIAQKAANILKDQKVDSDVRLSAAKALGNFGQAAAKYIPDILNFLKDEKVDSYVLGTIRARVSFYEAKVLSNFGQAAAKYIPDIANILNDEKLDSDVRLSAAEALSNFGQAAVKYIPDILNILKDEKIANGNRLSAAEALGNFGQAAAKYIPDILNFLNDEKVDSIVRANAGKALGNFGQAGTKYIPDILNFLNDKKVDSTVRASAAEALGNFGQAAAKYIPDIANILKDEKVDSIVRVSAGKALGNFGQAATKYIPDIANILKDEKVDLYVRLSAAEALGNFGQAATKYVPDIANILKDEKVDLYVRLSAAEALGNFGQAAAKYIPDIANILNDEKVDSIVRVSAAKALGNFGQAAAKYIPDIVNILNDEKLDSYVRLDVAEALENITKLELKEVVLILNNFYKRDDSGYLNWRFLTYFLGGGTEEVKTLLKWLDASQATPDKLTHDEGVKILNVFLEAWKGTKGLERLRSELAKQISEVAVNKNVLWKLQDISLLQSHFSNLKKANSTHANAVQSAYLTEVLNNQQSQEELDAVRRILSNPMDLTVVALMLSQGKEPNLFCLQEQQYNLMAAEYQQEWKQDFPLKRVSAAVYQMRLEDKQALPGDEFHQVVKSLEDDKYKMVVSRQWQDEKSEAKKEWYFRHDKIMDFFLVQNFLGESDAAEGLLVDRMGDPRFRGVYFLLATLLEIDAAKELREKLIQYAADTKDNTVSNTFVQLLRTR